MSLTARAQKFAAAIRGEWRKSLEGIFAVGRKLIEARAVLRDGEWGDMVVGGLPFGLRTAQMLMTIAEHPVLTDANFSSRLPPSWRTLYELTKLPNDDLKKLLSTNELKAEMTQARVIDLVGGIVVPSTERQVCPKCGEETLRRYKSVKVDLEEGGVLLPRLIERRLWVCQKEGCGVGFLSEETLVGEYDKRYIAKVSSGYVPE